MSDRRKERVQRLASKRPPDLCVSSTDIVVELSTVQEGVIELAERLGELAAELWLEGKLRIS